MVAKSGPAARHAAQSVEARRELVASGIKANLTHRAISELLARSGMPHGLATIHRDSKVLIERWRERGAASIEDAKNLDLQRIDDVIRSLQQKVLQGHEGATDRYLKAIALRADILGYSAPRKTAVGGWEGAAPITVHEEVAPPDLTAVPETNLRRLLAELESSVS